MTERFLTITLQPSWQAGLRTAAQAARQSTYQGEVLNFESPGLFFGQRTEKRWAIVRTAQGKGELPVRELPEALVAQVCTLIDEAPLPLIVSGIEEVAQRTQTTPKALWKNLTTWAQALQSPRAAWA